MKQLIAKGQGQPLRERACLVLLEAIEAHGTRFPWNHQSFARANELPNLFEKRTLAAVERGKASNVVKV